MTTTLDSTLLTGIEAHAAEIARGAGTILMRYFGEALDVQYKDKKQRDPVTNADKESQEYLKQSILGRFPDHGVLGEEDETGTDAGRKEDESPAPDFVWALDPLDGTKNFMSGLPTFACSVGVLHRGVPVAGAVFIPWPCDGGGVVLHARKGGGTFWDGQPVSVFQSDEPKGNRLMALPAGFGWMYHFSKPMRGKAGEPRVTGSIAYELAMTASGALQYTITTGPSLWDVAAGVVLVTEAGGTVFRARTRQTMMGLFVRATWEPMESFVPSWESGKTSMKELRSWRTALALGSLGVVRYITANVQPRSSLRRRLTRVSRNLKARRSRKR